MSEPKMTKGYARVVCENGHDIWGGETKEEAQKYVHTQCMQCGAESEENSVRWTPPRIIPQTEADELRAANKLLEAERYGNHQEIDRLRAALAKEKERADKAEADVQKWIKHVDGDYFEIEAERDALRAECERLKSSLTLLTSPERLDEREHAGDAVAAWRAYHAAKDECERLKAERRCTCDDHCDSPCPVHERENRLQDENVALRATLAEREAQIMDLHNKELERLRTMEKLVETLAEREAELLELKEEMDEKTEVRSKLHDQLREREAELAKWKTETDENGEPLTSDCSHGSLCGFCRAREAEIERLKAADQVGLSGFLEDNKRQRAIIERKDMELAEARAALARMGHMSACSKQHGPAYECHICTGPIAAKAREAALEEAAKECDRITALRDPTSQAGPRACANAIRALASDTKEGT